MSKKKRKGDESIDKLIVDDSENGSSSFEIEVELVEGALERELSGVSDDADLDEISEDPMPEPEDLPNKLGIVAVQHRPLFPHMVIPLVVEGELYQRTVKYAQKSEPAYIGIVLAGPRFDSESPKINDLCKVGVVARIAKVLSQDDDSSQLLLDVLGRIRVVKGMYAKPRIMMAKVEYIRQKKIEINDEIRAY